MARSGEPLSYLVEDVPVLAQGNWLLSGPSHREPLWPLTSGDHMRAEQKARQGDDRNQPHHVLRAWLSYSARPEYDTSQKHCCCRSRARCGLRQDRRTLSQRDRPLRWSARRSGLQSNFSPRVPKHQEEPRGTRDQRARRINRIENPAKSAKPPSPVQIRAAPPFFRENSTIRPLGGRGARPQLFSSALDFGGRRTRRCA